MNADANAKQRRIALRPYRSDDEEAAVALWLRAWQAAYPDIDFAARLQWWRNRWRDELVAAATIVVAESAPAAGEAPALIGFVTVDPRSGYLDQLVLAPEHWRTGTGGELLDAAKRIAPAGVDLDVNIDNSRAIAFYKKHGFAVAGCGKNPISGRPVYRMSWRP